MLESGELLVKVEIVTDITELLFDLSNGVKVGSTVESVAAHEEELDEVTCHITTRDIETLGKMRQCKAFKDWDNVRNTIARVNDDSSLQTLSVKRQYGLDGNIDTVETVLFEHDLTHLLAVLFRVHGWFGKQDLASLWVDAELLVESIVPNVSHVAKVLDNTVFHGLVDLEVIAQLFCFGADDDVLDLGAGIA